MAKMGRKIKETARALSPSGVADALGDYLLSDGTKKPGAKSVKVKK